MSSVTAVPIPPTKRSYLAWLWIGVAAAVAIAGVLAWYGTNTAAIRGALPNDKFLAANKVQSGVIETASGLQYEVLKEGTGGSPVDGDITLSMYKGTLRDGTQFDASQQPTPLAVPGMVPGFTFQLQKHPRAAANIQYLVLHSQFLIVNVAQESQGSIYDRTKEHLGASDEGVIMLRAMIRESIDAALQGNDPIWTLRDPARNQKIAFVASMQEIGALI